MRGVEPQPPGRLLASGRALARVSQEELARRANISVATLRRIENSPGPAGGLKNNVEAVRRALEELGVEFFASEGRASIRERWVDGRVESAAGPGRRLKQKNTPARQADKARDGAQAEAPHAAAERSR
jgi:transcriptional regulator with XRE-family HTH domain